jgi:DNA-binding MarR family transcriptional regulator
MLPLSCGHPRCTTHVERKRPPQHARSPWYHRCGLTSKRRIARARQQRPQSAPSNPPELPEVLQFMRLLWAIVHQLQKRSKRMTAELGVTGPQRLVLRVVGLVPGASAGTLAEILHVHPSTLTGVLQRLATQRLLRRSSHKNDRRRSVLYLTPRGELVNRTDEGTVESAIAAALRVIGHRDAMATERALAVIAEHLDDSQIRPSARRETIRTRRSRRDG